MTLEVVLQIGTTFVVAAATIAVNRWLAKADRDRTEQTSLMRIIDAKVTGLEPRVAVTETKGNYHEAELNRLRALADRWNKGPFNNG